MAERGICNAQLFTDVINEFERAIKSQNYPTPKLDEFLEKHGENKLKRIRELISMHNLSLVLHNKLFAHRRQESSQSTKGTPNVVPVYELVQEKLNHWTQDGVRWPSDENLLNVAEAIPIDELILWSAELWFIHQLSRFEEDGDIKKWIRTNGSKELFLKYFHNVDSNGQARFTVLAERDATDFLKGLLRVGNVGEHLTEFLEKWENIHKITKEGLTKEMASIYEVHSEKYHIIPPSRSGWRMYGMHFYLKNHFQQDSNRPDKVACEHVAREAKVVRRSLLAHQFKLREPENFNPENGTLEQLKTWLPPTLARIKKKCSMLFLSFCLHGFLGHVFIEGRHPDGNKYIKELLEIENILRWIHNIHQLRYIPKVVVLQTSNHIPDTNIQAPRDLDKIWNRLKRFVEEEMHNTNVCWSAEEDEKYLAYYPESYLVQLSRGLDELDVLDEPTIPKVHEYAHLSDEDKARRTFWSSRVGKIQLLPPSTIDYELDDTNPDVYEEDLVF